MKRFSLYIATILVATAAAFALSGCEAIGFGATGEGIPQVGQAKVAPPAISEEGVLRVGVDAANAPFSTLVDQKMVGINVDIAAALANEMGLKVKVVDVGANPEEALDSGNVDVVLGMDASDTAATCWLSDPYLSTAVAIFATSSGAILPDEGSSPTIEAQESSMSAWEITNQFGEKSLKAVPDLKTVFDDLESGSVSFAAADAIIGTYVSHTQGGKAQIVGLMQKAGGYCAGVAASNNDLKLAVTEAVKALRANGVMEVIESKWIGQSLNLDTIALTAAATKAANATKEEVEKDSSKAKDAEKDKDADKDKDKEKKESSVSEVGGNAVDLQDDGSTAGAGDNSVGVQDGYWGYTYDYTWDQGTTDTATTDTTDQTAADQTDEGNGPWTESTDGTGTDGADNQDQEDIIIYDTDDGTSPTA